jgi:hypothetical protein
VKKVENLVLLLKTNFYSEKITSLAADGTICLPGFLAKIMMRHAGRGWPSLPG